MIKVYIEYSSPEYKRLFEGFGYEVVDSPDDCDLGVFTGGSDVSPAMYGDKAHNYTSSDPSRDMEEWKIFNLLVGRNVPMVGICRGAQFLNVMSGGRMYQHVDKHCGAHEITDVETGETVLVSSTHHQMMLPAHHAKLLAFSTLNGSREWFTGSIAERDVSDQDIEVVYYERTNCLCFQPHPEFTNAVYCNMRAYFGTLVTKLLSNEL